MKRILPFLLLCSFSSLFGQSIDDYLNKIRTNEAQLTAFFQQMPKGGDLHHHFLGSIYAEPILERAIKEDFFLNTKTMEVSRINPNSGNWVSFSSLQKEGKLKEFQQRILETWSVKDYNGIAASDDLFFDAFDKYIAAVDGHFAEGLLELKQRAKAENVSYIETQLTTIPCDMDVSDLNSFNQELRKAAAKKDEKLTSELLQKLFSALEKRNIQKYSETYNQNIIAKLHQDLKIDDKQFTMRYQNFVLRFMEPVDLFKNLVIAFTSANSSDLIAGVNIVSPEDGQISMQDYWLHMQFFKFCHDQFPKVKYSMHAGELKLGLVQPEELTWHINAAVRTAGANRIGHGVAVAYEQNAYDLLQYMAKNTIPIEINLVSNEFILKVKNDEHPFTSYKQFGVPIVISTDDAGILRTNMTQQFVLLAKRYPEVSYADIKKYVYNSIAYSFIKDSKVKKQLQEDLDTRFKTFETLIEKL
ncbi:adenosine deaminase [Flavobacterium agrisoli]|uniref:adenosine deaminase n=1 Tax=Flavobacterium agrisoli TaxID=2793066 RepID=A0A934PPA8_9FLAO|nr:adenosine deaminase [Flavobacterium agrisoli]MBK0370146.1 adenosine deaminase [Flavobacterium agrisoli]